MPIILSLFLCLSILFYPALHFLLPYPQMHLIRAEYFLVVTVIIFFGGAKIFETFTLFKSEISLLFTILFLSMFGMIYQGMVVGPVSASDLMVVPRLILYFLIFIFSGIASIKIRSFSNSLFLLYSICGIFIAITFMQYYNLFGINEIIRPFSRESEAVEKMVLLVEQAGWRRALGTLGNPNYWGLALTMFACVVSYRLFWQNRWIYAPLLLGLMGSIWLTGSRSALASYVGALFVGGGLLLVAIKKRPSLTVAAFLFILALAAIARLDLSSEAQTSDRFSLKKLNTLEMRVATWGRIWNEMSKNPISFAIGQGTRKEVNIVGYADNSYVKLLREHGLFGLIPYLFLIGLMIRRTLKLVKTIDDDNRAWPGGLLLLLLAWAIFDLAADTWYSPRLMAVVFGLYAFVHTVGANRLSDNRAQPSIAATDKKNGPPFSRPASAQLHRPGGRYVQ